MSGHSKWATTKRQKAVVDAKRSSLFTKLSKNISIAARDGIDPTMNFKLRMAIDKAWSAMTFRTNTADLDRVSQPGMQQSGIRNRPRVVVVAGGMIIEGAGSLLGGIGVSGAPGGDRDDICAKAGIAAIQDSLDF